uniref:Rhamnosyl O-methyltransferase n=1 Tax=viral metagenome TaxID=1070528 RepID=A0A6C0DBE9_9ZZZZ
MELLEYHFSNLSGNLFYDEKSNKYEMFSNIGKPMHLNYLTFKELFKQMNNNKNMIILESGIASAGTQSTYLFNEYVRKYGGQFLSVDINQQLVDAHRGNMCPSTTLICDDSINFFKNWVKQNPNKKIDVCYLDSYDLDFYNPQPSAMHGLNEYLALLPAFKNNSLLLIDDTPSTPYWLDTRGQLYNDMIEFYNKNDCLPGKGQYVLNVNKNADTLLHNYQVLYKFN